MSEPQAGDKPVEYTIVIDGEKLSEEWGDDLSFREHRELREKVRELVGDPQADVDMEHMAIVDWLPALVYMWRKRKDPEYTLEQVLDTSKPSDFLVEDKDAAGPPTKAAVVAAKAKARAKR